MIDNGKSCEFSMFPDVIPSFFWPVNKWQSVSQYITWAAAQFVPKQIWILCLPNMIPALKEHIGEICTFTYFSSRREKFKKRNVNIPVYYWANPSHLRYLYKKEKTFQMMYLASKVHKSYSKIMLSGRINKFLFLDHNCLFDKSLFPKIKNQVRDCKNHLFKFKYGEEEHSFLNKSVPVCMDITQINTILKFYNSIKNLDKKIIPHSTIMSCFSEKSFDGTTTVDLSFPLFTINKFTNYCNFIEQNKNNNFSYLRFDEHSLGNISIKQLMMRKAKREKCFFFSFRPMETNIINEDGTRTPVTEGK
jgi:hypothetical protein